MSTYDSKMFDFFCSYEAKPTRFNLITNNEQIRAVIKYVNHVISGNQDHLYQMLYSKPQFYG